MYKRYQGNSGRMERVEEKRPVPPSPAPPAPSAPPPPVPVPPLSLPGLLSPPPRQPMPHSGGGQGSPLELFSRLGLDAEDLLMLMILYLLYRESGDTELLMIIGAMFFL